MNDEAIKKLINQSLKSASIKFIKNDGYHCELQIVAPDFNGLNKVQRQQLVYKALQEAITSGQLHAITIHTISPEEIA